MNTILGAFRSKTIWWNIITGVLAFLALPEFLPLLPAEWLPKLALINAAGNLILRFLTNQPLAGKVK